MTVDMEYGNLIRDVLEEGETVTTRNAVCRRSFCTAPITFHGTPLVSARKTAWRNSLREFEFFLSGSDDINDLHPAVRHWWEPFCTPGTTKLPHNYSVAFRRIECPETGTVVDQIADLIDGLTRHPNSRRNCVTTWIPQHVRAGLINPTNCHGSYIQCVVDAKNRLHMKMYQRSVDVICGLPHNLVQYHAFLLWLAHRSGRGVGTFRWDGGDVHVYEAHLDLAARITEAVSQCGPTPEFVYAPTSEDFKADDFSLAGEYRPVLTDRAEMIV